MSAGTNGLSSVIPGDLALAVLGVQLGTGTYPVVRLYTSNRAPSGTANKGRGCQTPRGESAIDPPAHRPVLLQPQYAEPSSSG